VQGWQAWPESAGVDPFWNELAGWVQAQLAQVGVVPRDAVLLLPFVQHLPLARKAFGAGWAPRIETTRSLASALCPNPLPAPGQPSGDAATDALVARQLLLAQGLKAAELPGGTRGLALMCNRLVELTQALLARAAELAPTEREAWWTLAQQRLQAQMAGTVPAWEGLLAQVALAWAQTAPAPATDALFRHPAKAWILLEAAEPDRLGRALLAASGAPHWVLSADQAPTAWLQAAQLRVREVLSPDAQDLAARCALRILEGAEQGGCTALIALDRSLVRRVLALLAPYGLRIADETGATLSAQAPAAALMHLLRAAQSGAMDELLAWLKGPLAPLDVQAAGVDALEAWARRHACAQWRGLALAKLPEAAQAAKATLQLARDCLSRQDGAPRSLSLWLLGLRELLRERCGLDERLASLPGLGDVGEALWLTRNPWPGSAAEQALLELRVDAGEWLAWVDERLRAASASSLRAERPQLVITPLARALLRPFDRILLAGCDQSAMALGRVAPVLVPDALAAELGLPHRAAAQSQQWESICHLLRAPELLLLRARTQAGVQLEWGWPIQRLLALWPPLVPEGDQRAVLRLPPQALSRAQAHAPGWLPARLSAAAAEALRVCPYRFFAQRHLGLAQAEELDLDPDGRDWGAWLHRVLALLHAEAFPPEQAAARWQASLARCLQDLGLSDADALGLQALLERWREPYLRWWHQEQARGVQVQDRERELRCHPWQQAPLSQVEWVGVADRIDEGPQRRLLDYKTGSASGLKQRLRDPQEDTQLPFYQALLQDLGEPLDEAAYLALDAQGEITLLVHPEVAQSAARLRSGLAEDLLALHAGAPLKALGEGLACAHCEARGLCRRDDWSAE